MQPRPHPFASACEAFAAATPSQSANEIDRSAETARMAVQIGDVTWNYILCPEKLYHDSLSGPLTSLVLSSSQGVMTMFQLLQTRHTMTNSV